MSTDRDGSSRVEFERLDQVVRHYRAGTKMMRSTTGVNATVTARLRFYPMFAMAYCVEQYLSKLLEARLPLSVTGPPLSRDDRRAILGRLEASLGHFPSAADIIAEVESHTPVPDFLAEIIRGDYRPT